MAMKDITASIKKHDKSVTVPYDFGDDLKQASKLFGAEVVHSLFQQAATVNFQALLRRAAVTTEGEGDAAIEIVHDSAAVAAMDAVTSWKPGVSTRVTKSPRDKAMAALSGMTPDERLALLQELEAG